MAETIVLIVGVKWMVVCDEDMDMMICPKCGRYMTFSMTYIAGSPVVIWSCVCGYDSSKERIITTNRTEILNSNIFYVTNQSNINEQYEVKDDT